MKILKSILFVSKLIFIAFFITACGKDNDSNVIVTNTGNHAPSTPSNPVPQNDAILSGGTSVSFRWDCTDSDPGDTLRFAILFSTSNPPTDTLVSNLQQRVHDLGIPAPGTYYWKVTARDESNTITEGPVWKFRIQ